MFNSFGEEVMKKSSRYTFQKSLVWTALLVLTLSTTACGSMSTRGKNTAIGAGVGAVAGAVLTGGSSIGTVGGAAVGGVIGNQIHKK
jgi:osmotically inducible lipoprotein OsmB